MTFTEQNERFLPNERGRLEVGEVAVVDEELTVDKIGRPFFRRRVEVGDESDRDPTLRQAYRERANRFEMMLQLNPDWKSTALNEDGSLFVDPRNKAAMDLYFENGWPTQMTEWGRQMKKAIALEGLQNLERGGRFLPGGALDKRTLELFRNMTDGIGLRSRQHIYREILQERAEFVDDRVLRIASLGSGAAVPNIEATLAVEATGKRIEWQLFDLDPEALGYAEGMVSDASIQHSTFDYGPLANPSDKTKYRGRNYLEVRHAVADESLDVVDALGLWEYLTDSQAVTFLKVNYKKLKHGAPMIVANMLKDRPHPRYNQDAVGWPDLFMRNEEDMLTIVQAAGIDTQQVRLTYPEDNVYVVMEIYK